MKLKRLFKLQRELDERIVKEKGLSGQELFGLGKQLGFTFDQIEAEYLRKNALNHHRQECGY